MSVMSSQLDLFSPDPERAALESKIVELACRAEAGRRTLWRLAHSAAYTLERRNRSRWMRSRVRRVAEASSREAFEISARLVRVRS
ncbi:MAG TPA: hypothetical protein VFJ15_06725 [Oleiagrimonas sp.]|nr:hypothetical protein [Oleiagrimonas sp.]